MISNSEIIECLEAISPYGAEELLGYSVIIDAERERINARLKNGKSTADAVMLAAARVNYRLALIKRETGGVKSFRAGDVSITEGNETLESARALLEEVSRGCPALADGEAFDFRTV
ncbi:MAG: hypothetical protein K6C14_00100 [Eubacterium sp.]|nr:hypothetical protein [Eubacterium sp.]